MIIMIMLGPPGAGADICTLLCGGCHTQPHVCAGTCTGWGYGRCPALSKTPVRLSPAATMLQVCRVQGDANTNSLRVACQSVGVPLHSLSHTPGEAPGQRPLHQAADPWSGNPFFSNPNDRQQVPGGLPFSPCPTNTEVVHTPLTAGRTHSPKAAASTAAAAAAAAARLRATWGPLQLLLVGQLQHITPSLVVTRTPPGVSN
jgi:hypothetical protein